MTEKKGVVMVLLLAALLVALGFGQVPEVCQRHDGGWHFDWEKSSCTALIQVALNAEVPCLTMEDPTIKMPLATDGVFASETAKAVEAFQRRWHLHPDGVVGPATLSFLFPDQPLIQLVQLEAGHVAGVNATLGQEVKQALGALLELVRCESSFGSTYRVYGRPVFSQRDCRAQSSAAVSALVPGRWKVAGAAVDFAPACRAHDACYAQLPKAEEHRLACDEAFWRALREVCAHALPHEPAGSICRAWTAAYFAAVRNYGAHVYEASMP